MGWGMTNIPDAEWNLETNHPIGSWWASNDPTSPASRFGGTWEKLVDRMLVGAGGKYSVGSTGGEETHVLLREEMPSHNHSIAKEHVINSDTPAPEFSSGLTWAEAVGSSQHPAGKYWNTYTKLDGEGKAHNNMSPYYATYIWRRIA